MLAAAFHLPSRVPLQESIFTFAFMPVLDAVLHWHGMVWRGIVLNGIEWY